MNSIEKLIDKIQKELSFFSSEELIKTFTAYMYFRDEKSYSKDYLSAKGQILIAYAMKIASSTSKYDYAHMNYTSIIRLVDTLFNEYQKLLVHSNEDLSNCTQDEKRKMLVESITEIKYLFYRKEGYTVPVLMFGRELYKPLETLIKESYGFTYMDLERLYLYVTKIYKKNLLDLFENKDNLINSVIKSMPNISQYDLDKKITDYVFPILKGKLFEIRKSDLYEKFSKQTIDNILKIFSVTLQNNLNKTYNSPLDFNDILSHPILDFGEYVILPDIRFGLTNLPKLLHYDIIGHKNISANSLLVDAYSATRGKAIENCVAAFFGRIFDESNIYTSLNYGKNNDYEADVTINCGNVILLCECKGKLLNLSSLKGNYNSIKSDFGQAIQSAYNQSYRTQEHIRSNGEFSNGKNHLKLNKDCKIIKLCIIAENFGFIASNPYYLLNLKEDDEYPIVFNIHDLNTITNEIKSEQEMINYLIYRQDLSCRVHTLEEIDTLISFQKNLTNKDEPYSQYIFLGITQEINNKYLKLAEEFIDSYQL
ncbi:hypothetical protein [Clostridium butyricum]